MARPYTILLNEIMTDPDTLGFSTKTDAIVANDLNTNNRARTRSTIQGGDILAAVEDADLSVLTILQQGKLRYLISAGTLDITNSRIRAILRSIFSGRTATLSRIAALQSESVSIGDAIGFGFVRTEDVTWVRRP